VVVSPSSVYQTISQLRKALGDTETPPSYIETVSRKGYRLVASVAPVPAVAREPDTTTPAAAAPARERPAHSSRARTYWLVTGLATLLTAAGAIAWFARDTPPDSIVVLPFEDLTPARRNRRSATA
jgi:hypothetical protein